MLRRRPLAVGALRGPPARKPTDALALLCPLRRRFALTSAAAFPKHPPAIRPCLGDIGDRFLAELSGVGCAGAGRNDRRGRHGHGAKHALGRGHGLAGGDLARREVDPLAKPGSSYDPDWGGASKARRVDLGAPIFGGSIGGSTGGTTLPQWVIRY
jgi:hypothetical protein